MRRIDADLVTASTPVQQGQPQSILSPTRLSRLQEKTDLQGLNDWLACYIDRVSYLEQENFRLTLEVQTLQETVTREVSNIKQMYEHELTDARKLLDKTVCEKAKIDAKRIWKENDDLKKCRIKSEVWSMNLICALAVGVVNGRMLFQRSTTYYAITNSEI